MRAMFAAAVAATTATAYGLTTAVALAAVVGVVALRARWA